MNLFAASSNANIDDKDIAMHSLSAHNEYTENNEVPNKRIDNPAVLDSIDYSTDFTVKINGSEITNITRTEDGYTATEYDSSYNPTPKLVDKFSFEVDNATSPIDITFGLDRLAYLYDDAGGYLASCGANNVDGSYANNGQTGEQAAKVKLVSGKSPLYVWVQTPYDDSWSSSVLYVFCITVKSGSKTTPVPLDDLTKEKCQQLHSNIINSFAGTSDEWKVVSLCAGKNGILVDRESLVENAYSTLEDYGNTDLQRFAVALNAAGLPEHAQTLIDTLFCDSTCFTGVNACAFALIALDCGDYNLPSDSLYTRDTLIDKIADSANVVDGGFGWADGQPSDADSTAIVLSALAQYKSQTGADSVISNALAYLKTKQDSQGNFDSGWGASAESNSAVVNALCALGIDPNASFDPTSFSLTSMSSLDSATFDSDTPSPYAALLSFASSDLMGFTYSGTLNDMSTTQGYMGMTSYNGFVAGGGAPYNVYFQSESTQSEISEDVVDNEDDIAGASSDTGDNLFVFIVPVFAAILFSTKFLLSVKK
ncbi:MAG: hypothetical protein MJ189_02145 [Coriobacteriales bacterium]|nr:hypothetical protein [Coriobacteriales bacterium]